MPTRERETPDYTDFTPQDAAHQDKRFKLLLRLMDAAFALAGKGLFTDQFRPNLGKLLYERGVQVIKRKYPLYSERKEVANTHP